MSHKPRDLWLVGGLHDDLGMPAKGEAWLRAVSRTNRVRPRFVAVEWPANVVRAVLPEADHLRRYLRDRAWPGADSAVLEAALATLCWEATVALQTFNREVPIVWLEDGVDLQNDASIIKSPRFYLEWKKAVELTRVLGGKAANAASMTSARAAWNASVAAMWVAAEQSLPTRRLKSVRDHSWADAIDRARHRYGRGWAAVFVGAAHATRFDSDTLASVLDARDIRFRRRFLAHPPWLRRTG
jgi:hypothetical protein